MARCLSILLLTHLLISARLTFAQTIPPQLQTQLGTVPNAQHKQRAVLKSTESAMRIREAGELFRTGALPKAVAKLRGTNTIVRFDSKANPQQTEVAQALIALTDGNLRVAFNKADAVHRAQKNGWFNVDAALVKSLVYFKVKLAPSALYYSNWVRNIQLDNNGAEGIKNRLNLSGVGTFTKVAKDPHPWKPECRVVLWQGGEKSPQPLVATFSIGSRFIGALTVDELATEEGKPSQFVMIFRDLDGPPITFASLGSELPSADALKKFAGKLCPTWESGQYSTLRGEIEALRWKQLGVAPFATQWAAYAINGGSRLAKQLQSEMRQASVATWKLQETDEQKTRIVLAYTNKTPLKPQEETKNGAPVEYVCFVILSPSDRRFLDCYVVRSEQLLSGERVFCLERRGIGRREILRVYDDLPTLAAVTRTVVDRVK